MKLLSAALLLAAVEGGLNGESCGFSTNSMNTYEMYESDTDPGGVWNAGCMAGCLMAECDFDVHPTPPSPGAGGKGGRLRRRLAGGKSPTERGCGSCNAIKGTEAENTDWCDAEERMKEYSETGEALTTARTAHCNSLGDGEMCEYAVGWDYNCYKDDFQHSFAADRRDVTWNDTLKSCVCDKCGTYIQEGLQGLYCNNKEKMCVEHEVNRGFSNNGYSLQGAYEYAKAYLAEDHLCPNHDFSNALPMTMGEPIQLDDDAWSGSGMEMACDTCLTHIDIKGFAFGNGRTETVVMGSCVCWKNLDAAGHSVQTAKSTGAFSSGDSGMMKEGDTFVWTPTAEDAGEHSYYCAPHGSMKGTIMVEIPAGDDHCAEVACPMRGDGKCAQAVYIEAERRRLMGHGDHDDDCRRRRLMGHGGDHDDDCHCRRRRLMGHGGDHSDDDDCPDEDEEAMCCGFWDNSLCQASGESSDDDDMCMGEKWKACANNTMCEWDKKTKMCSMVADSPVPSPTPRPDGMDNSDDMESTLTAWVTELVDDKLDALETKLVGWFKEMLAAAGGGSSGGGGDVCAAAKKQKACKDAALKKKCKWDKGTKMCKAKSG